MELDRAKDLAWSLVVRSGHISLPHTRLVLVQRNIGDQDARVRREEFYLPDCLRGLGASFEEPWSMAA